MAKRDSGIYEVGVEIVRFPIAFPQRGRGKPATHRLDVPHLSVVVGACVIPPLAEDGEGRVDGPVFNMLALAPFKLHVEVNDFPVIDGERVLDVLGTIGARLMWRSESAPDPVILTPREGGVEVVLGIEAARTKHDGRKFAPGWECWLYVAR